MKNYFVPVYIEKYSIYDIFNQINQLVIVCPTKDHIIF